MRHIRLRGLDRPPFCKLHAGFAESITWLEKGLLRIGHPFRPPGTSRVKMPFVLVYSPPIDGKCLHALSILVSPHICCRPDQCPYAVREGSFHPQRNIITHATRSSSTESRTFVFTAHLAGFGVISKSKQKGQPMTALTASSAETEALTHADPAECATTALTQLNGHAQRCTNPFCRAPVNIKSTRGKHGRYCSDHCRMDGYALKRAKALLLRKVAIIRFHELMDELGKATTYGAQSTENRQESTHDADEGVRSGQ
jgi:hypothetical protein